jgi:serine/threonine-protein kinase RsbW
MSQETWPNESWTWRFEKTIFSETAAGKRILEEVLRQLEMLHWNERDVFGVHLALEEALVNAIKHGNRCDASKRVHVECRISPRRFFVEVRDEGQGFNPEAVPDCTDEDRLEMPGGRGVLLMRSFMSSVEYNPQGNCVVMTKERSVSQAESTAD